MSSVIMVFEKDSAEWKKLKAVAEALTKKSPRGYRYYVGDTYFDYGQGWMWTTILATGSTFGDYQALNPRNQEEVILGSYTAEEMADRVLGGTYCPDRIEKGA